MTGSPEHIPDERPQRRREYTGSSSTLGVALLVVLVVGVAIWWFEFRVSNPCTTAPGLGVVELPTDLNPTSEKPAGEVGRAAPNFTLLTPEGERSTLTDFRGEYVLLNFWASWCGPCRGEAPELQRFAEEHEGALTVLGVNLQEEHSDIDRFVREFGLTFPMVVDADGQVSEAFRMPAPPISVLVNPAGLIVRYYLGALDEADLEGLAAEYLG